jgi:RNA polymerase sigma-70 factor, ECF subfamily
VKDKVAAFGNLDDEDRRIAIADLHALYSKRLYRTIMSITRNSEDAEDVLQETFLRAYVALDRFRDDRDFIRG